MTKKPLDFQEIARLVEEVETSPEFQSLLRPVALERIPPLAWRVIDNAWAAEVIHDLAEKLSVPKAEVNTLMAEAIEARHRVAQVLLDWEQKFAVTCFGSKYAETVSPAVVRVLKPLARRLVKIEIPAELQDVVPGGAREHLVVHQVTGGGPGMMEKHAEIWRSAMEEIYGQIDFTSALLFLLLRFVDENIEKPNAHAEWSGTRVSAPIHSLSSIRTMLMITVGINVGSIYGPGGLGTFEEAKIVVVRQLARWVNNQFSKRSVVPPLFFLGPQPQGEKQHFYRGLETQLERMLRAGTAKANDLAGVYFIGDWKKKKDSFNKVSVPGLADPESCADFMAEVIQECALAELRLLKEKSLGRKN